MDSQQAKQILWLYRPGVDDADPQFAEALAYAERNPEVREWLDKQNAEYAALRAKVKDIRVPAELPYEILDAGRRAHTVVWWRRPFAVGTAAAVVVAVALYSIMPHLGLLRGHAPRARTDFAAFRNDMVYYAAAGYKLDVKSSSLDELREEFAVNGWPSDYTVPSGLAKLAVRGGCLTKWNERKVSMLCLMAPNDHRVWLYVIARVGLSNAPKNTTPRIAAQDNFNTASWSEGNKTYFLVAEGDDDFVRSLL